MKKFRLLALVLAVVLIVGLAGCGTKPAETGTSAAPSAAASAAASTAPDDSAGTKYGAGFVFKQGFDLAYPPYSYRQDDGTVGGFDVEVCQALCELLGWTYEAVPFNWDAKDAELKSGACDCIWSGFTLNGREDDYLWSLPYSDNTQVILVAEDSGIATLADLAGKLVGVQTDTSAYTLLNDPEGQEELLKTFKELKVYETYPIAFADLQAGAIDAIAIDITQANFHMSNAEGFVLLEEKLAEEEYAIGFRLEDTELRDIVNNALLELVENGTFDTIGQKYPEIYEFLGVKTEA